MRSRAYGSKVSASAASLGRIFRLLLLTKGRSLLDAPNLTSGAQAAAFLASLGQNVANAARTTSERSIRIGAHVATALATSTAAVISRLGGALEKTAEHFARATLNLAAVTATPLAQGYLSGARKGGGSLPGLVSLTRMCKTSRANSGGVTAPSALALGGTTAYLLVSCIFLTAPLLL